MSGAGTGIGVGTRFLYDGECLAGVRTPPLGRYTATQTSIQIDPELAAKAPGPRRAVELTYGMLRGYGLAEPDLTDAVRLLRSTFHGFVALEAAGGFAQVRSPQHSWVRALDACTPSWSTGPRPEKEPQHDGVLRAGHPAA